MKCSSSSSMFLKASSDREKNIAKQMTNWRAKKSSTREKKAQPPIRAAFRKMSMRWKMAGRKCFVHRRATPHLPNHQRQRPCQPRKKIRHLNIVLQTFARARFLVVVCLDQKYLLFLNLQAPAKATCTSLLVLSIPAIGDTAYAFG